MWVCSTNLFEFYQVKVGVGHSRCHRPWDSDAQATARLRRVDACLFPSLVFHPRAKSLFCRTAKTLFFVPSHSAYSHCLFLSPTTDHEINRRPHRSFISPNRNTPRQIPMNVVKLGPQFETVTPKVCQSGCSIHFGCRTRPFVSPDNAEGRTAL